MREPQNILDVATQIQPNYMGFIFYEKSPRYVQSLSPALLQALPPTLKKTGVFVNAPLELIHEKILQYDLQAIQLHGSESPEYCQYCKATTKLELIKAFAVATADDLLAVSAYVEHIDMVLLDAKGQHLGGNGATFDWTVLQHYHYNVPFWLSGGISPTNLPTVAALRLPQLKGIDVNSKFEVAPALKSIALLQYLCIFKNSITA